MAFSKIIMNGETLMDLTQDTVAADKLVKDITAHGADGTSVTGSYIPPSGSSYTLLATQDFTVSTTSTTPTSVGSIVLTANEWTKDKIIYVKVRDKAGPRQGYFLGNDSFIFNVQAANGNTTSNFSNFARFPSVYYYGYSSFTSGDYGVYADTIKMSDGVAVVDIYTRYSGNTRTINGTYNVEVYALDYAPNGNPFSYSYT